MKQSELNLMVLENFILHITHCSEEDNNDEPIIYTPNQLYKLAVDYIEEDHVDGKGNPDENKTIFNVTYYDKNDEVIDSTQIDEDNEDLAWELFKEFGHTKIEGMRCEITEGINED